MKASFSIAQCANGWVVRKGDDLGVIWERDIPEIYVFPTMTKVADHIIHEVGESIPATQKLPNRDAKGHFVPRKKRA